MPGLVVLEDRRLLSTFTVESTADDGSTGTLRWAVAQANAATDASTIDFNLPSSSAPITLTQGHLELTNTSFATTIEGPAGSAVAISGNHASAVFQVDSGVTATLSGLTITEALGYFGGGIYNRGTAVLTDCTISGNSATLGGAGVYNWGTADLTDCTIRDNSSNNEGGGLSNSSSATLRMTGCTVTGNTARGGGGGLFNFAGRATLTGCTISDNSAATTGGGVSSDGMELLTDCTISGNSAATAGGGLFNDYGTETLTGCTISGNAGGGLYNGNDPIAISTLTDTIVAGNSRGGRVDDIDGPSAANVDGSNNLIGIGGSGAMTDGTGGNIVLTSLAGMGLAPLGDYGGPTRTMALLPGSRALGAGAAIKGVTSDQRGLPLDAPRPDIGAFQSQGFLFAAVSGSTPQSAAVSGATFAQPLAVTVTARNPDEPVTGGIVTFTAPTSGASAVLSVGSVMLDNVGEVSVTALSNSIGGTYSVAASIGADTASVDFNLTNEANSPIVLSYSGLESPSVSYGDASVTLSGTLANGSQAPRGEDVTMTLDNVTQHAAIGAGGAFSITFDTSRLEPSGSPYTVEYSYAGDATFAAASVIGTVTVNPAMPVLKVTDFGGTYNGSTFPATATVAGVATGVDTTPAASLEGVTPKLTYYAGGNASGTPLAGAPSAAGAYTVVASFGGSTHYAATGSAPVTFTIGKGSATIALSSSGGAAVFGQSVSFVATVTGAGGTPTGTVTFSEGGTVLGTVALDGSGQATLSTSALALGSGSVTATYNGDVDFLGATSGSVSETVGKAATRVVLVPHAVRKGKKVVSIQLVAEVEPMLPGGGLPTGPLRFLYKKKTLGTATLSGGKATLTLKAGSVLKKAITVVYGGDADDTSSTTTHSALTQKSLKSLARPMVAFDRRGRIRVIRQ